MDLTVIRKNITKYAREANQHRQALNTATEAYEVSCSKDTKDIERTREFLEQSMDDLQAKLCESIYLLEFYYIKLCKKRPTKAEDKKLVADGMLLARETLLSVYHGSYYQKDFDPADSYTETKKALLHEREIYFERALVTQNADLLEATLDLNQNPNTLMLINKHELYPIEYAVLVGNVDMATVLCEAGARIGQETFKDASEKNIALVSVLLRNGYKFDDLVLGYLIQQWNDNGHQAIDYLIEEGALHEKNLLLFRDALKDCDDLQFAVIIGDMPTLIDKVSDLEAQGNQDALESFCKALNFAASSGRENMTRYLLHVRVMDDLFKVDGVREILIELRDKVEPVIAGLIDTVASERGVDLHAVLPETAEVYDDRSALKSSVDVAAEKAQREVDRLRANAKSWFSLWGNSSKADSIEAALLRAQKSGAATSERFYNYKEGSLPSLGEALARPRIGFFQATAAINVKKAMEEHKQAQQESHTNRI